MDTAISDYEPGRFGLGRQAALAQELWPFLNAREQRHALMLASDLGHPAVVGVAEALLAKFGDELEEERVRQLVGHMTRQVMEANGYQLDQADVKVAVYPFTRATRYRRRGSVNWTVFRSSQNPHELCIVGDRSAIGAAPKPSAGRWVLWTTVTNTMQAAALQVMDAEAVRKKIAEQGYALHSKQRMMRKG